MSAYPKAMTHPNATKSQITRIEGVDVAGRKVVDYSGTADRFPPVTVTNEDQEARHRAQGYLTAEDHIEKQAYEDYPVWMSNSSTGDSRLAETAEEEENLVVQGYARPIAPDPEAVERAYAAPYVPGQSVQEWPKVVNGVVMDDPGGDNGGPKEFPKWVHHPDRSQAHLDICVENAQQESEARKRFGLEAAVAPISAVRKKLETLAEIEGISFDAEWTDKQLRDAILKELPEAAALNDRPVESKEEAPVVEKPEELILEEIEDKGTLIAIAEDRGVYVDKRWSVAKIRDALIQDAA